MATFCATDDFWYDPSPMVWPGGDLTPPPIATDAAESGWLIVATGTDPCGQYGGSHTGYTISRTVDDGPYYVHLTTYTPGEGPFSTPAGDLYRFSFGPSYDETDPEQNLPDFPPLPPPVLPESPPGIGSAAVAVDYLYEVVDNDGNPLDPLPLTCSDFANVLSAPPGQLNATLPRTHPKANRALIDPPGRELVVSRNGKVCWNGPITWVRRSRRDGTTQIRAHELLWYLYNARLEEDRSYTDTDVFDIVRDLVDYVLAKPGGARFAFTVTSGLAGVTKTIDYLGAYRLSIGQIIEDLATDPTDGFDFRLTLTGTCAADISRTLELGAPSLGTAIVNRKLQPGGGLYDLVEEADIERAGNRAHLLPGLGDTLTLTNDTSLAAGDPSIEAVLNRPDLDSALPLAAGVIAEFRRLAQPPVRLLTASYIPRADLPYDWCALGDTVLLADPDVDIDDTRRVGTITTRPPGAGSGEMVDLTLNLPLDELGT